MVELAAEVEDAVTAANHHIGRGRVRETQARTEIAVADAPNGIGHWNKCGHGGVGDEVQSVDPMVSVVRRIEKVITKAEIHS